MLVTEPMKEHELSFTNRLMRGLMHVPHGLLCAYELDHWPHIGWSHFLAFMTYEISENHDIHDYAFPDIAGFLGGQMAYSVGKIVKGKKRDEG